MERTFLVVSLTLLLLVGGRPTSAQVFTPTKSPDLGRLKDLKTNAESTKKAAEAALDTAKNVRGVLTPGTTDECSDPQNKLCQALTKARAEAAAAAANLREAEREIRSPLLPDAGFEAGTGSPQMTIDVARLYFRNPQWRLYIRSTIPVDATPATDNATAETTVAPTRQELIDDGLRSSLNDPYGGLLYLAAGRMVPLNCLGSSSLDIRGGAKLVQLPQTTSDASFSTTPVLAFSAGLRIEEQLFHDSTATSQGGLLNTYIGAAYNLVVDRSVSPLFAKDAAGNTPLSPNTININASIGLTLTGSLGLTVNGTLWSNSNLDRRFVLGLMLLK